jgi:hypothetical protein
MTNPRAAAPRVAAGLAMIAAPLLLIVGALLHPTEADSAAEQMNVVRDNLSRWYTAHLVLLIGLGLLLPALLALAANLRGRAPGWYVVGATLAGTGIFLQFGGILMDGMGLWLLGHATDHDTAADLAELTESGPLAVPFRWLALTFAAGLIVLGAALWLGRQVAIWKSALIVVAGLASAIQLIAGITPALGVTFLALAIALVPSGIQALMSAPSPVTATPPAQAASPV